MPLWKATIEIEIEAEDEERAKDMIDRVCEFTRSNKDYWFVTDTGKDKLTGVFYHSHKSICQAPASKFNPLAYMDEIHIKHIAPGVSGDPKKNKGSSELSKIVKEICELFPMPLTRTACKELLDTQSKQANQDPITFGKGFIKKLEGARA